MHLSPSRKPKGDKIAHRVTPASAIPQIPVKKLKQELLGKYRKNCIHRNKSISREAEMLYREPSHGKPSPKLDGAMKGTNRARDTDRSIDKIERGNRDHAQTVILHPMSTEPPKERPK